MCSAASTVIRRKLSAVSCLLRDMALTMPFDRSRLTGQPSLRLIISRDAWPEVSDAIAVSLAAFRDAAAAPRVRRTRR